jgi:arylsulfatase A-like enzyme/lipopolysaccharide biosynthesis regulator YciM
MTGLFPNRLGVRDNAGFPLSSGFETLAEALARVGYRTGAFISAYVLNHQTGIAQGFETFMDRFPIGAVNLAPSRLERPGSEVATEAVEWIEASSEPFFLWVHFYDPHAPYEAPRAFRDQWPNQPYDAEVAASDWALGELLRGVPEPINERTVYVVTADHGESLGEHGEPEHGFFLYDATLKVPLIFAGPGLPECVTLTDQVRHVDIFPTVLALLGISPPEALDGEDLSPLIEGKNRKNSPISYAETAHGHLYFGSSELRAVRNGKWKYIEAPKAELYHVSKDPHESVNRLGEEPKVLSNLTRRLEEIRQAEIAPNAVPIDSATADQLRSLGYVGGAAPLGGSPGDDPKDHIEDYISYLSDFNDALQALESKDGKRAERIFTELVEKYPSSFDARQYLGRALFAQGKFDSALNAFHAAIPLSPQSASIYLDVALTLAEKRDFDSAFEYVQQGIDAEPGSFYGFLVEGVVARGAGQDSRAMAAFEKTLSLNPEVAMAEFHLGEMATERGDKEEAIVHYRKALQIDPLFLDARNALNLLENAH